jgi:hypothetical protein
LIRAVGIYCDRNNLTESIFKLTEQNIAKNCNIPGHVVILIFL